MIRTGRREFQGVASELSCESPYPHIVGANPEFAPEVNGIGAQN
jgi:hypothetical protein